MVAPPGAEPVSERVADVRWFGRNELPDGLEPEVVDLVELGRWL